MFVQVIQGRVGDAEHLRQQLQRWVDELSAGAKGWLGSTHGVTEDGEAIAVVRFESAEDARRNSNRPEQGSWWAETERGFAGPVTFHDCDRVEVFLGGGSDDAGFVQVVQGRARDEQRYSALEGKAEQKVAPVRPDIIGGLLAWHGDGGFTEVIYFTSEEEARKGERQEYPADVQAVFDEWNALTEDMRYLDLRDPQLLSP
jgi:hypothetical protein